MITANGRKVLDRYSEGLEPVEKALYEKHMGSVDPFDIESDLAMMRTFAERMTRDYTEIADALLEWYRQEDEAGRLKKRGAVAARASQMPSLKQVSDLYDKVMKASIAGKRLQNDTALTLNQVKRIIFKLLRYYNDKVKDKALRDKLIAFTQAAIAIEFEGK